MQACQLTCWGDATRAAGVMHAGGPRVPFDHACSGGRRRCTLLTPPCIRAGAVAATAADAAPAQRSGVSGQLSGSRRVTCRCWCRCPSPRAPLPTRSANRHPLSNVVDCMQLPHTPPSPSHIASRRLECSGGDGASAAIQRCLDGCTRSTPPPAQCLQQHAFVPHSRPAPRSQSQPRGFITTTRDAARRRFIKTSTNGPATSRASSAPATAARERTGCAAGWVPRRLGKCTFPLRNPMNRLLWLNRGE